MKKERKLKLQMNKISVSKLNHIKGAGSDLVPSVDMPCEITTEIKSVPGEDCKTVVTIINRSLGKC